MKCSNGFASGFEGGSDNYRLLHAWDDRLWVAQKDQGSFNFLEFFAFFAVVNDFREMIWKIVELILS